MPFLVISKNCPVWGLTLATPEMQTIAVKYELNNGAKISRNMAKSFRMSANNLDEERIKAILLYSSSIFHVSKIFLVINFIMKYMTIFFQS